MGEVLLPFSHSSEHHFYLLLSRIEKTQGDKSGGRTYFMRGIQGEVCRPVWNRDYLYLLGLVQQVPTNLIYLPAVHTLSRTKIFFHAGSVSVILYFSSYNYSYQIREYLQENCVPTVLSELYLLAVDIFSRYNEKSVLK